MFGLSKSFYAKVFLLFIVTTLGMYVLNQLLVGRIGGGQMRKVFIERQININLRWAKEPLIEKTDDELKEELLETIHIARPDEVRIFTAIPETSKSYSFNNLPFTEKFQDAKVVIPEPDDDAPQVERAIITFENMEWNATKLITPHKIIVALVNTQAAGRHMEDFLEVRMRTIKQIFPFSLMMSILAAFFVTRKTLAPIKRIQDSLRAVDTRDLTTRVPHQGEDTEFREFIDVFNNMLARLERGFLQASRFSSDAAHELRTPLTIMQGYIERAIVETEPGSKIQIQLRLISDEIERLSSITQKLLLLAQADGGQLKLDFEFINVSDMLGELVEDMGLLEPPITTRGTIQKKILFETDRALFQQLLNNLFTNAVKYNIPEGWIDITAWAEENKLHIRLSNPTDSISEEFASKAFDRFSRGDGAHNRKVDGTGLGLSLCREIAHAHQGELSFDVFDQRIVTVEFTAPLKKSTSSYTS
jgi:two-component system, OmpR family, heavy metal sensor histidine kinase CusS